MHSPSCRCHGLVHRVAKRTTEFKYSGIGCSNKKAALKMLYNAADSIIEQVNESHTGRSE